MGGLVRIGVDIGGTFTDLALLDADGRTFFTKISSTPTEPEKAVLTGIEEILRLSGFAVADIKEIRHGTTVGSNTLLQKAGARCGLITTKGFRDILEIGRVRTPSMFDLSWDKPEPLVPRRYRLEADERTAASGEILKDLDEAEIACIGRFFQSEGIKSVAICFLNSYRNGTNEARAEAVFRENFPDIWVSASVSVLPELGEYERTSTTAVNAYVLPVLRSYLIRLESQLRKMGVDAPLLICNSNGGLSSATLAREKPVFFISSGRSAGVVGSERLCKSVGVKDLIVFDMGGTTASASLVQDGRITRTKEYEFRGGISTPSRFIKAGGYLMRVPTVDVAEVGSGAGSIAWLDDGNLLHVGPVSAGADPGPASYRLGGDRATVTDANVVLGFLPDTLAGGFMKLDIAKARDVIARDIAVPLGLSVEDAAWGVREVVNANMARAIRAVTVERGVDPRGFTLLAFGGSGPAHACDLAATLGIDRVLFPRAPGIFTAMGMLAGHVERYFSRAHPVLLAFLDPLEVNAAALALRAEATEALAKEGYGETTIEVNLELDLRFRGQDSELPIPLPRRALGNDDRAALREAFLTAYSAIYGYASKDDVEVVNIRLLARGINHRALDFATLRAPQLDQGSRAVRTRKVYFDRRTGWRETPVMDRGSFSGTLEGPIVLEGTDSTIVIPVGVSVALDAAGNVVADIP